MPLAFLLSLQASGMVIDWLGKNEQVRLGKMGAQVEQAGITANIQTSRLQTEEDSLESMKQLRANLGTQAAILAARGTRPGTMNSVLAMNESVGNFNANERLRKINQMGNEANLKAGKLISSLHEKTFENNTWNTFRTSVINKIPTSPSAWGQIRQGFSAKSGYGFGLTPVTGGK